MLYRKKTISHINKSIEETHIWREQTVSWFGFLAENLGGAAAAEAGTGRG